MEGYSAQKNFAATQARSDWIFSLDADERVSPGVGGGISRLKQEPEPPVADSTPRLTFYLGRWIKHPAGTLIESCVCTIADAAAGAATMFHETLEVDGPVKRQAERFCTSQLETRPNITSGRSLHDACGRASAREREASVGRVGGSFPIVAFIRSYSGDSDFWMGFRLHHCAFRRALCLPQESQAREMNRNDAARD